MLAVLAMKTALFAALFAGRAPLLLAVKHGLKGGARLLPQDKLKGRAANWLLARVRRRPL
jgi:hypothetical protein